MSEWTYVNAAYVLTWLTFALYALSLRRRRRRAETEAAGTTAGRMRP